MSHQPQQFYAANPANQQAFLIQQGPPTHQTHHVQPGVAPQFAGTPHHIPTSLSLVAMPGANPPLLTQQPISLISQQFGQMISLDQPPPTLLHQQQSQHFLQHQQHPQQHLQPSQTTNPYHHSHNHSHGQPPGFQKDRATMLAQQSIALTSQPFNQLIAMEPPPSLNQQHHYIQTQHQHRQYLSPQSVPPYYQQNHGPGQPPGFNPHKTGSIVGDGSGAGANDAMENGRDAVIFAGENRFQQGPQTHHGQPMVGHFGGVAHNIRNSLPLVAGMTSAQHQQINTAMLTQQHTIAYNQMIPIGQQPPSAQHYYQPHPQPPQNMPPQSAPPYHHPHNHGHCQQSGYNNPQKEKRSLSLMQQQTEGNIAINETGNNNNVGGGDGRNTAGTNDTVENGQGDGQTPPVDGRQSKEDSQQNLQQMKTTPLSHEAKEEDNKQQPSQHAHQKNYRPSSQDNNNPNIMPRMGKWQPQPLVSKDQLAAAAFSPNPVVGAGDIVVGGTPTPESGVNFAPNAINNSSTAASNSTNTNANNPSKHYQNHQSKQTFSRRESQDARIYNNSSYYHGGGQNDQNWKNQNRSSGNYNYNRPNTGGEGRGRPYNNNNNNHNQHQYSHNNQSSFINRQQSQDIRSNQCMECGAIGHRFGVCSKIQTERESLAKIAIQFEKQSRHPAFSLKKNCF